MAIEKQKFPRRVRVIISVLIALLILSSTALVVRMVYLAFFADKTVTTVVPNNIIGEESNTLYVTDTPTEAETAKDNGGEASNDTDDNTEYITTEKESENTAQTRATVIELYKGQTADNDSFKVHNMLPGDREIKYYAVKVSHHGDVGVFFEAEVTEQTKALGEILNIKVTHLENNKILYDGSFADINPNGYSELFSADDSKQSIAYYKIEVSLPTSADNRYQAAQLTADFNWFVTDASELESPPTGDRGNTVLLIAMMLSALALTVILLFFRRKGKEDEYAEK